MVLAFVQKAMKGDIKAIISIITLVERMREFKEEPMPFKRIEHVIVDPKTDLK